MSDTEKRKLSQARVADLRADLEKRGLDKNGVKAVLVERLVSALTAEGLSSADIDEYIVESGSQEATKKLPKRGSTPSKTKDEDELMVDLDNKSEVLDYGENDDLETNKEENSMDTTEIDRESEVIKKEEENKPAALVAEKAPEEDEFQVLDEEASDIEDTDNKESQQQDGNVDNEDSIHLTLNEDDEKLLIGEDENGFSTESDAPAAARSRTQVRKKEPAPYKHSASGSGSSTKKQSPSKEDDKVDKHEDSSSAGDTNSSSSDKKKASSPKGTGTERSRTSVDEKHSSVSLTQQQSDQQQEGVNGDKSRSGSTPKESKEKTAESNDKQRENSPSNNTSGRNLWVSGLSSTTRATDLKQTFSKYGKVLGAKVVTNARTPGARCYGFVTMAKREDASRCIQHLDRTELHGRMISVEKAKGEASGPGRVKTPTSPSVGKDHKQTEGSKDNHKKESSSSKSNDSERDQRRESRDKSGKPVRQRITAPSPGPGSERSTSRTAEQPRSEESTTEPPFQKKRTHTRSPPARPPPRRVNHSPGGGLHTRRSNNNATVLTFASIKQARDRQRLREREREDREHARRRDEEARRLERRQREEQMKIEREKEELRLERERIEKARKDILRLEREKAKLERERLEWEREELRRQQQKLREMAERAQAMPPHVPAAVPTRSWTSNYSSSSVPSAARYSDVRRSTGSGTKRLSDHHGSDYFDERAAKRPAPTGGDERRAFDSTTTAPPPPRFSSSSSSTAVKRADNRRDIDFSHRSSGSSLFDRSSAGGPVSGSASYDRSSGSGRRDTYFPNSSTSSSAGRVVEPTRREPDPPRGAKDDRFRDSYRPSVRSNERPMSGRDVSGLDSRSGQLTGGSGLSGSSSSSRPRDRYPEPVGRGIPSNAAAREPWLGNKNDISSSSSSSWSNTRTSVNPSADKWMNPTTMSSTGRTSIFNTSVSSMGMGLGQISAGPPSSNPFGSAERYDAYKQPLNSIRKY